MEQIFMHNVTSRLTLPNQINVWPNTRLNISGLDQDKHSNRCLAKHEIELPQDWIRTNIQTDVWPNTRLNISGLDQDKHSNWCLAKHKNNIASNRHRSNVDMMSFHNIKSTSIRGCFFLANQHCVFCGYQIVLQEDQFSSIVKYYQFVSQQFRFRFKTCTSLLQY